MNVEFIKEQCRLRFVHLEILRQNQQRMEQMEKRFSQPQTSHTYTPGADSTSFTTPQRPTQFQSSTPVTPATPTDSEASYMNISGVSYSPADTAVTPQMSSMKLGQGHGHPCKQLIPPSFDECPPDASPEEVNRWKKAKTAAEWWYKMKTDPLKSGEYRSKENE